jgi:hypothetical protein
MYLCKMKLLLCVLALCAILFATNPGEKQFRDFIKEDVVKKTGEQSELAKEVIKVLAGESSWINGLETERKNFYLLSLYSVRADEDSEELRYIGVLSHFFKLD